MAFKQVKRRSSLFRPWASAANHKLEKHAQDAQDHLKKLKGFVSERIISTESSKSLRFENLQGAYKKQASDVEDSETTTSKDEAHIKENLDAPPLNRLENDCGRNFVAPDVKRVSPPSDRLYIKTRESDDQGKKQKSFQNLNTAADQPSAFVRTTKIIKTAHNQDISEQMSSNDLKNEINSVNFDSGSIVPSQLHYDALRTFPLDGSHIFQDNGKHNFIPAGDITHSSLLSIPSGDSVINNLAEFGSSLNLPANWDPFSTAGLTTLTNTAQHPLLETGIISRWRTKKQRPKRFQCPHCQVSFSNNGQLKGHVRIHTGERPFACDHPGCGKTFTRNEELTRHKRIHTGVRPFPCPLCGKRFGRKDHLKKHVKTHQRAQVVQLPMSAFQGLPYFVGDCLPWF